jgi:hypothetical protein
MGTWGHIILRSCCPPAQSREVQEVKVTHSLTTGCKWKGKGDSADRCMKDDSMFWRRKQTVEQRQIKFFKLMLNRHYLRVLNG